jgi:hypothetical protein
MSEKLTISLYKKTDNRNRVLSDGIKLGLITGGIAVGVQALTGDIHKKATTINGYAYFKNLLICGGIMGITQLSFDYFSSMWQEVTEYRPDKSPFTRDINLSNTDKN